MNRFRFFPTTQIVGVFLVMGMLAISCGEDKSFNISDTTQPSTPAGLSAAAVAGSSSKINLTWSAATDNTTGVGGVQGYRIIRNGTFTMATGNVTAVTDSNLVYATTYTYAIESFDGNGNISERSTEVSATTNDD